MRISALRIPLLALLVLVPTASRLAASGDPPKAEEQDKKKKKIVIASPEKEVIVDGDRVTVVNDGDDPEIVADLAELDDEGLPGLLRFHGRSGGYLGVHSVEMTSELRQHFGAPKEAGVFVGTVEPESPAAKAGLKVGDIITAVDGEGIGSTRELSRSVRRRKEGEKVKIDVLRDRSPKSLSVTVVERKDREMRLGDFGHGMRGFRWRDWDSDGPALAPVPPVPPVLPIAPDGSRWNGLRDRLDSLEKRLREIESRLPKP